MLPFPTTRVATAGPIAGAFLRSGSSFRSSLEDAMTGESEVVLWSCRTRTRFAGMGVLAVDEYNVYITPTVDIRELPLSG